MTENLPAVSIYSGVVPYDAKSASVLDWCLSGAVRGPAGLELINYPSEEARKVLSKRNKDLVGSLAGFDKRKVAESIGDMLTCFNQYNQRATAEQKAAFKSTITKFVAELHGIPGWACVQACDAIRLAKSEAAHLSRTFPPSTIELRALAQTYVAPIHAELKNLGDVLQGVQAPAQLSGEERKALGAQFAALADEIGEREAERGQADAQRQAQVARSFDSTRFITREYGKAAVVEAAPGIPISKALAANIARPRERHGW